MNMAGGGHEARLARLGIDLPAAPAPVAAYEPVVISGSLLWVSGQLPVRDGGVVYTGPAGGGADPDDGTAAARLAALNAVAQIRRCTGTLDRVMRIVQVTVYVNSAPGFTGQPGVANGASEVLVEIFGEAGRHSRAAVGVSELPLNATVELTLVAEIAGSP